MQQKAEIFDVSKNWFVYTQVFETEGTKLAFGKLKHIIQNAKDYFIKYNY